MPDNLKSSEVCRNCNSENINNYCCDCGQKVYIKRFTVKSFFHFLLGAFNIEKGFLYTFKMLFIQPGVVVNDYLSGKTRSYYNPFNYILIAAGIYAFLIIWLKIYDTNLESATEIINSTNDALQSNEEALLLQQKWLGFYKQYVNFVPLLMIPFTSLISKWFFRSHKLFYGEHLIINCFLFAQTFFISILLTPLAVGFSSIMSFFPVIGLVVTLTYLSFSYYKTFKESVFESIMGTIIIYVVGFILFILVFMIVIIALVFTIILMGYSISDLL